MANRIHGVLPAAYEEKVQSLALPTSNSDYFKVWLWGWLERMNLDKASGLFWHHFLNWAIPEMIELEELQRDYLGAEKTEF